LLACAGDRYKALENLPEVGGVLDQLGL
jgi:hypothetical protein